jgi:hypothetical protein
MGGGDPVVETNSCRGPAGKEQHVTNHGTPFLMVHVLSESILSRFCTQSRKKSSYIKLNSLKKDIEDRGP